MPPPLELFLLILPLLSPAASLTGRRPSPHREFPLVAIPMFVLAGVVMNRAGITRRLLNLAEALVGQVCLLYTSPSPRD